MLSHSDVLKKNIYDRNDKNSQYFLSCMNAASLREMGCPDNHSRRGARSHIYWWLVGGMVWELHGPFTPIVPSYGNKKGTSRSIIRIGHGLGCDCGFNEAAFLALHNLLISVCPTCDLLVGCCLSCCVCAATFALNRIHNGSRPFVGLQLCFSSSRIFSPASSVVFLLVIVELQPNYRVVHVASKPYYRNKKAHIMRKRKAWMDVGLGRENKYLRGIFLIVFPQQNEESPLFCHDFFACSWGRFC